MKKRIGWWTSVAVFAFGMAFALVGLGNGWWSKHSTLPYARVSSASVTYGTLTPRVSFYGNKISAAFTVLVNRTSVDPETVSAQDNFSPYKVVERSVTVEGNNRTALVRFNYTLQCIEQKCLDLLKNRLVLFAPTKVYYRTRNEGVPARLMVYWPPENVESNLSTVDIDMLKQYLKSWNKGAPLPFWTEDALSAPTYRWGGAYLIWAVLVAAGTLALIGLFAVILGVRLWQKKQNADFSETSFEMDAFQRALLVAHNILSGADVSRNDRAWALGFLAERCREFNWADDALTLDALAWAPEQPDDSEDMIHLAAIVKKMRFGGDESIEGRG